MQESFTPEPYEAGDEAMAKQELAVTMRELISEFHLETARTESIDLSHLDSEEVIEFFERLVESGAVLHGANVEEPLALLRPQEGDDVKATSSSFTALIFGVFHRTYVEERLANFVAGVVTREGKPKFEVSPEIYRMFIDEEPRLVDDGYVYVLNRGSFEQAHGDGAEDAFFSKKEQVPKAICKISKNLGKFLLVAGKGEEDTVFPF